jgi:hypothetical protein
MWRLSIDSHIMGLLLPKGRHLTVGLDSEEGAAAGVAITFEVRQLPVTESSLALTFVVSGR